MRVPEYSGMMRTEDSVKLKGGDRRMIAVSHCGSNVDRSWQEGDQRFVGKFSADSLENAFSRG